MNNEKLIPVGTKVQICLPDKDPHNYKTHLDDSGNMLAYDGEKTMIIGCAVGRNHNIYKLNGCSVWNWSDDTFVVCDAPKTFGDLIS